MPKKKRSFIDKKQAETYHLVRRSQRDVGGYFDEETGEPLAIPKEFVLLPDAPSHHRLRTTTPSAPPDSSNNPTAAAAADESITTHDEENRTSSTTNKLARARLELARAGLLDEYDYDRHLKPITGSGVFLPPPVSSAVVPPTAARGRVLPMEGGDVGGEVRELDRQLDAIAISADCMDDDVAQALFGDFEEGGFEEILDDFCFTAGKDSLLAEEEEEAGVAGAGGGGGGADEKRVTSASNPDFDFDKHVQMLIERAKREDNGGTKVVPQEHEWWQKQQDEFSRATPHHLSAKNDSDDDDGDSWDQEFGEQDDVDVPPLTSSAPPDHSRRTAEEEKVLCDKFAATLLEYDSDELGDLDPQYREIAGDRPLEGDGYVDAAVAEFLVERKAGMYLEGTVADRSESRRTGGSSHVLVGRRRFDPNAGEVEEMNRLEEEEKLETVLRRADETLAMGECDLPPEEVLIDGKSYFTMKERNPWDCESILSTYSNMDNNPAVIGSSGSRRRGRKKKKGSGSSVSGCDESLPEGQPVQIRLSNKTGLPLDIHEGDNDDDDDGLYEDQTFVSVNKGIARRKGETKEEKQARKRGVKEEREISRMQKKMMREAIENEFRKHAGNTAGDDVAGKSVFRF